MAGAECAILCPWGEVVLFICLFSPQLLFSPSPEIQSNENATRQLSLKVFFFPPRSRNGTITLNVHFKV